jgi:hypothetical protein
LTWPRITRTTKRIPSTLFSSTSPLSSQLVSSSLPDTRLSPPLSTTTPLSGPSASIPHLCLHPTHHRPITRQVLCRHPQMARLRPPSPDPHASSSRARGPRRFPFLHRTLAAAAPFFDDRLCRSERPSPTATQTSTPEPSPVRSPPSPP